MHLCFENLLFAFTQHACIHVSVVYACVLFTQFCEYEHISVHREMARVCLHVNKNVCTVHTQNTVATQRFGMNVILVEIVLHIHTHTRVLWHECMSVCFYRTCTAVAHKQKHQQKLKGSRILHSCACMLFVV